MVVSNLCRFLYEQLEDVQDLVSCFVCDVLHKITDDFQWCHRDVAAVRLAGQTVIVRVGGQFELGIARNGSSRHYDWSTTATVFQDNSRLRMRSLVLVVHFFVQQGCPTRQWWT